MNQNRMFPIKGFPTIWKINLLLVLIILALLFLRYFRPTIYINCEYNSDSNKLLELVNAHFKRGKKLSCIFIFNDYPSLHQMEIIEKIRLKFQDKINVYSLFSKRFRVNRKIDFPHSFVKNKIVCRNRPELRSFFILLKDRIIHFSHIYNLDEMMFLIGKNIHSDFQYENLLLNPKSIKEKILLRIMKGELILLNLLSNKTEVIDKIENKKIILIHSACTSCQLERIFKSIKDKGAENQIYIFSFWASSTELIRRLSDTKMGSNFYLDYLDEFNLALSIYKKEELIQISLNLQKEIRNEVSN